VTDVRVVCTVNIGSYIMYVSVDSRTSCASMLSEKSQINVNQHNNQLENPFLKKIWRM